MPHSLPDRLLPNEVLVPGEVLVSMDQRFRLEFTPNGYLRFLHFVDHIGVVEKWRVGPGVKFTFDDFSSSVQVDAGVVENRGRPRLLDASGRKVWEANPFRFRRAQNYQFVVQDDGNVAFYGIAGENVYAQWGMVHGLLPDQLYGRAAAVIPGETIATVATPGVVLIATGGQGQGEVINVRSTPSGIRAGSQFITMPPGATVSVAAPGTVELSTAQYEFDTSTMGVLVRQNADAIAPSPHAGGRWKMEIGGAGLMLRVPRGPNEHVFESVPVAAAVERNVPVGVTEQELIG